MSGYASAHEFTPTYPKLKNSYVEGVLYTTMTLFNMRKDVEYYEFGVFNAEWEKVPFAMQNKVMRFKYLEKKKIDIYIREKDKKEVVYICSKSKLIVTGKAKTSVSSRICSKVK
tara:strand:+ start:461 stop:802 length:342 start_codon:yes stop_codon:yes gene_type:complete